MHTGTLTSPMSSTNIKERFLNGNAGPWIGLFVLCVFFSIASDHFLSVRNLLNVLDQITVLGILALGMTAVIIIGGIDLSVGAVLALSMMVMGLLTTQFAVPIAAAAVIGILTGGLCGLTSGLLVTVAHIPAFIATLTMMSVARGLANLLTNGQQIVGYPGWFTAMATTRHFGLLSITVGIFIALAIASFLFFRYRANGRNLYAIGGSPEVARLSGIAVTKLTVGVYVAAGAAAGIAGMALASRLNSSQPSAGLGYELDTIAAVVIGGASLAGGVGSVSGTIIGVLIIGVLRNGLNLLGVSPFVQQIVIGLVIAVAVAIDSLKRRSR